MKNLLITLAIFCSSSLAFGQSKTHKFGISAGGSIQHYNGNLGNSFFKFNTTCFGGVTSNFGLYLNRSFDAQLGASIGNFGYCQTEADETRVVALEYRCPGCTDQLGMGELRSLMISGNVGVKYKFANGYILKEDAKFAPSLSLGFGVNQLYDNMQRNCVNEGTHLTLDGGLGLTYNITSRINISYNLGVGCFMFKKVYASNGTIDSSEEEMDEVDLKLERRKDMYMRNSITLGFNF